MHKIYKLSITHLEKYKRKSMAKKKNGIALIKKSNDLIDAKYKFSIWEMRVFLSILAQIHRDDTDFKPYRIWYKDVIKKFNLKSAEAYNYLREAGNSLLDKKLYTNYFNDGIKRDVTYNIFGKVDTLAYEEQERMTNFDKQGYIDITVHPDMKPFLLQLQKNFTAYDLRNVTKLGVYPIRIYELLKQYESIGNRKLEVEEVKEMFELNTEYPLFANFYQRVIEPAIKEINEYTDIWVDRVEKLKEGKRVVALHFFFRKKTGKEVEQARKNAGFGEQPDLFSSQGIELPLSNDDENETISIFEANVVSEPSKNLKDELFMKYQQIVVGQFGVSPSVFFVELEKYDNEAIEKAIRVTERTQKEGRVGNIPGFFIEALRKGFTDQEEQKTIKRKQKEQEDAKKKELIMQMRQDLIDWDESIKNKENSTIRRLVSLHPEATDNAIAQAKGLITKNPILRNRISPQYPDLEAVGLNSWREDEQLREIVKDGFKVLFPQDFEFLKPMLLERERLLKQMKELGKN